MKTCVLMLPLLYSIYSACCILTKRDTATASFLPYIYLDTPVQLLSETSSDDVDICSPPINVPGGLPFGKIRAQNISVCENGVILIEATLLKSSLCVCRGEFKTCEDPGESVYAIAPFWSNVNNLSATQNTSISFQAYEEGNNSHAAILNHVWSYIYTQTVLQSIQFFPTWILVAHWFNVHPYIKPNEIDPRTNTFQAILATDGTQTYAIFTYNCSDLGWARTPNSFVASDCSFIGAYAGGSFNEYLPETTEYGLQIDSRTANITRAASCSSQGTTWNNFLFVLTPQRVVNLTAREKTVGAEIGESVTVQFYISTFFTEDLRLKLSFIPECQCSGDTSFHSITCNGIEEPTTMAGIEIIILCSTARINVTISKVTEGAFGDYIISASANEIQNDTASSSLKLAEVIAAEELFLKTSDPSILTSDDIASASSDLQDLQATATTNENVRQNYLKVIDNLMQADGSSIVQSQMENNSSSRILDSLQQFTLNVELPTNITNETFIFNAYGIQLFDLNQNTLIEKEIGVNLGPRESVKNVTIPVNISFSSDKEQEDLAVYVKVRSDVGNSETDMYRLSVIVYRQENLFQNNTSRTGVNITSVVMSVVGTASDGLTLTMGFQALLPTTYEEENRGTEYGEVCSNFNTGGNGGLGAWSGENCEEIQCTASNTNYTCCECHTYGHFGLLLAVTPVVLNTRFEVVLVVFSYIGAALSVLCLVVLLITYVLAKKLHSSTSGKLLINLGVSLLGVYMFFIVGGHIRPYGDTYTVDIVCGFSSAILHYFMLAYFGWTAAEAVNLYFTLVKVFEVKSVTHYTLKAGLLVWVVPLIIVTISAGAGHSFYINDVYCRPVEWPFYFAFVLPIAIILLFDGAMFLRIMLALYEHTKQRDKLKNTNKEGLKMKQIKQNTRYAIVLVTLFGLGWIFGLVVTGYPEAPVAVTFTLQFGFCLFVSLQGVLLFVFQVLMSRDARDFWLSKLEMCFPSIKTYRISDTQKAKQGYKKKTIMNRVTGLFKTPKYTENVPDSPANSTIGRSGHTSTGITESFEASYQMSTLPRPVTIQTPSHSTTDGHTTEMRNELSWPDIDFDKLSLQDDF